MFCDQIDHTPHRFIWKEEEVKALFATKQWPTFIGVPPPLQIKSRNQLTAEQVLQQQVNNHQKQSMPLPVLVWKEQTLPREIVPQTTNAAVSKTNKRKRSDSNDNDVVSHDNVESLSSRKVNSTDGFKEKQPRIESSNLFGTIPQTLGDFWRRQVNRVYSFFFGDASVDQDAISHEASSNFSPQDLYNKEVDSQGRTVESIGATSPSIMKKQKIIFEDLRSKGYFVGPGDVYGGDYCIYKGRDPSESHSVATVRMCSNGKISAKDLLCFSRVQNQVAKSAILAFSRSVVSPSISHHPTGSSAPEVPQYDGKVGYVVLNFRAVSARS